MNLTIEEILAIEDIGTKIQYLKKGRGKYREPNTCENLKDWNTDMHEIMDPEKYKDKEIIVEPEKTVFDKKAGRTFTTDAKTEKQKCNRISLPIEQDQTNIHTSFTVGTEPNMDCDPADDGEKGLLSALNYTLRKNKIKYLNKKEVRSYLSEQEVAEYWWADVDNDNFWAKLWKKVKTVVGKNPTRKLKCTIWSPFRGDKLYPFFVNDDLVCFMREYKQINIDGSETQCYMAITKTDVMTWKNDTGAWSETKFKHGFSKLPVIYMYRPETLCHRIKTLRIRLEKLLSQYGDCIDYNFFPYLLLYGQVEGYAGKAKNHVIQMSGTGASASYLTWDQAPDVVKFEANNLIEQMYALTNTPRISFENLKSVSAPSGAAFKFYFMGAHMAVENHAEDVGPFMQRRANFLVSALGDMNAELYKPSQTLDIETELVPYMIDSISDKVQTAVAATGGPIWDKKTGIAFVGNVDKVDEVYKQLQEEQKESKTNQDNQNIEQSGKGSK